MTLENEQDRIFDFDNSYARLPRQMFVRLDPTPVGAPRLLKLNVDLARELMLDPERLSAPEGVAVLAGNHVPEGAEPIATAYAGHQFGVFVPQLGDGRAVLLGEVIGRDGRRRDIQLKGSGPTPFSRNGDGRAALGPVLREYLLSEAMAALGVPTTRALAAVATGEAVYRESPLPGALLTRVAASHIRVGSFQYFAARRDLAAVKALADHTIARHYPELADADHRYLALLETVVDRQAKLIAQWMSIGFIHGVMNTDNTSVAGETIDYGPCAFLDVYHPDTVFSSIDRGGRYAYANQPRLGRWNLGRFAEAILTLIDDDPKTAVDKAQRAVDGFPETFESHHLAGLRRKLGLMTAEPDDDALARDLLRRMALGRADFTLTFRSLAAAAQEQNGDAALQELFNDPSLWLDWAPRWRARLAQEPVDPAQRRRDMDAINPCYIPRNHLVEEVISAAVDNGDLAPFHRLHEVLSAPFDDQPASKRFADPPRSDQIIHQTFCGT